jgi:hypothetical protein
VELLVVVVILTTIVAAAIPILAPTNDERRLREASRALNTFITGAQARAISLDRPYGIALKRLSQDTDRPDDRGVCLEVFYVEQQPPFAGFDRASKACVAIHPQLDAVLVNFVRAAPGSAKVNSLPIGILPDLFPSGMFRPGDVIEIQGTQFELLYNNSQPFGQRVSLDQNGFFAAPGGQSEFPVTILARPINDSGQQIQPEYDNVGFPIGNDRPTNAPPEPPPPYWTEPAPYRILRQPTFTSDEPYQLPEGTAIDLRASSVGSDVGVPGRYFYVPGGTSNSHPVMIMFAPEGRVARVTFSQAPPTNAEPFDEPVVDNIFLLVGKRENVPAPDVTSNDEDPTLYSPDTLTDEQRAELRGQINWLSGSSRWIVIGWQSGRIVTIENALVDPAAVFALATGQGVAPGSEGLRNRQILTAREFTREMSQLGGR